MLRHDASRGETRVGARVSQQGIISWAAPAAWGAGLILLALGAGELTAANGIVPIAATLVAFGLAGIVWGTIALARGRVLAPRTTIAAALAGLITVAIALGVDPDRTSVVAVAVAAALHVAVALGCGLTLRVGTPPPSTRQGTDAAQPRLAGLVVSAVIVAAVVTPALSATEAGRLAPDHGGHGLVVDGHDH